MSKFLTFFILISIILPCQGQWTQLNDVPFINDHSNGFGSNGKGYIIQGSPEENMNENQNRFWEYDPQTDNWTMLGLVPGSGRELSIGDDMDGKYYFGFGWYRNDLWEYNPATNAFTQLPSCPCEERGHPAFVAHKGKIYMGAGSAAGDDLKDWWVFDFATETWSQKMDIPGDLRHHPYQFGIDDAIYVGGGHEDNWLKFDINTETWSAINDFPKGRVAGTQFSYDGKGFVLSGDKIDHSALQENSFLMYIPDTDGWYNLPFIPEEMHRWAPSSFIIEDELFYFGGYGTPGNDQPMWKFDLSSTQCLTPTGAYAINITENSAGVFWSPVPAGAANMLQWRILGTSEWSNVENPNISYNIEDLAACTDYEYRIQFPCTNSETVFSDIGIFKTRGCGACIDETYCDLTDDAYYAFNIYIERVQINDFEKITGNNDGYLEHSTTDNLELVAGETFNLEVDLGFAANGNFGENSCAVWIDFNGNGNFDNNEIVVNENNINTNLSSTIIIPEGVYEGVTRMRIIASDELLNDPCEGSVGFYLKDGEVEDYCIMISSDPTSTSSFVSNPSVNVQPNPFTNQITIKTDKASSIAKIELYNITGVQVYAQKVQHSAQQTEWLIPTHHINEGMYILALFDKNGTPVFYDKLTK